MGKFIGAEYLRKETCTFRVWSPFAEKVELVLQKNREYVELQKDSEGYWERTLEDIEPGTLYKFRLDEESEFPDPASRSQPEGVHSWSQVTAPGDFIWNDAHDKPVDLADMVIYELHVGTFTPGGTFEAVIEKLDHLKQTGINTLEIMPVAQFPGNRNWGYDGVYPFAPQSSYGGPDGLKKLVDACHQKGMCILLDVVYNHLGPEGSYLAEFGPYFTDKYHTPWGKAINFDDRYSDHVRNYFIQNTLMWLEEFHFDGLRLDAIHEIIDRGANHFLKELSLAVDDLEKKTGRHYFLIAESDLNDSRIINTYDKGGYGLEAQWVDDFHHSLHTLLTGEDEGYYKDYGKISHLAKAYKQAFVYDGIYSRFRKRRVGNSPEGLAAYQRVVCIQNHDQVGNRMLGERLSRLVSFEQLKLAAGVLLTAPFVPMLFMGEEFGETNPFQYFVSHGDPGLVKAVREGRKKEFEYFLQTHSDMDFPDPQAEETFEHSKINWDIKGDEKKNHIYQFYKELLRLRKNGHFKALRNGSMQVEADVNQQLLHISATEEKRALLGVFNFGAAAVGIRLNEEGGSPELLVASADKQWGGPVEFSEAFRPGENLEVPPGSFMIYKS